MSSWEHLSDEARSLIMEAAAEGGGRPVNQHEELWHVACASYLYARRIFHGLDDEFPAFAHSVVRRNVATFARPDASGEEASTAALRRDELARYRRELLTFDISLIEVGGETPLDASVRRRCLAAAEHVASTRALRHDFYKERRLPVPAQEAADAWPMDSAALAEHARYITALVILLSQDLPLLQAFLDPHIANQLPK